MKNAPRCFAVLVLGAAVVFSPVRSAAQPSASERETARTLHLDGRAKLAAKDYAGALEKIKPAHDIMHVPTTGFDLAKAQEGLGMLIEARATALEVANMQPQPSEPEVFAEARTEAARLAEKLAPRIPSLVIQVKAPAGVTPAVTVDASEVSASVLGIPWKVNPGPHTVTVTAAGHVDETRKVTVKEAQTLPVEIALRPAAPAAPALPPDTAVPQEQASGSIPAWAWISGAAGIAAVGAAVGFGIDYSKANEALYQVCPDAACPDDSAKAEGETQRGRWNRDLGLTVTFAVLGAAGLTTGIIGIATASPRKEQSGAAGAVVAPWIGPAGAGMALAGRF